MKRNVLLILTIVVGLVLFGCGKKAPEDVNYSEGLIFKITSTPIGLVEKYKEYTLNIEIYDDGNAVIYANNFDTWYGDADVPNYETTVKLREIEEIKQLVYEKNITAFNENIGNKDGIAGDEKYLYLYTDKGVIKTGGVSPSNKRFLKVYDSIYKMVLEEVFTYTAQLEANQKNAIYNMMQVGIKICDSSDELLFDEHDIKSFSMSTAVEKIEYSTNTDVNFEIANNEIDKEQKYNIIIELNDEAAAKLTADSINCSEIPKQYNLLIDGVFQGIIIIDSQVFDGRIRLQLDFDETMARETMEDWSQRIVRDTDENSDK